MNLTDSPTFTSPVQLIDDGDPLSNAEFLPTAQALANRTAYLNAIALGTRRVVLSDGFQVGTRFVFASETSGLTWRQDDVTSVGELWFQLRELPIGRKITSVVAYWLNKNNTTLAVGTMPKVGLYKKSIAAGDGWAAAKTLVAEQADTTAVVATYKLVHTITIAALTETIDLDEELYVKFEGETGTNATTGGNLVGFRVVLGD